MKPEVYKNHSTMEENIENIHALILEFRQWDFHWKRHDFDSKAKKPLNSQKFAESLSKRYNVSIK